MPERPATRSALPLSLGVALIGSGLILSWVRPYLGVIPVCVGLLFLVWGVYLLADSIERAARALIKRDRV